MRGALVALTLRSLRAALNTMAAAAAERLAAVQLMQSRKRRRSASAASVRRTTAGSGRRRSARRRSGGCRAPRRRPPARSAEGLQRLGRWCGEACRGARVAAALDGGAHAAASGAFNRWLYELQRRARSGARSGRAREIRGAARCCAASLLVSQLVGQRRRRRRRRGGGGGRRSTKRQSPRRRRRRWRGATAAVADGRLAVPLLAVLASAARRDPGHAPSLAALAASAARAPHAAQAVVHAQSLPSVGPPPTPPGWTPRNAARLWWRPRRR